jgi:hypothetical protein
MTTTAATRSATRPGLWATALATGAYALVLVLVGTFIDTPWRDQGSGEWQLNTAGHSLIELPIILGFVVVGVAVVFGVVVRRGLLRPAERTAARALVVALIGVAAVVVFWTGLPVVLAGAAAVLAADARARLERHPSAIVRITLGIAALLVVAATWLAVTG